MASVGRRTSSFQHGRSQIREARFLGIKDVTYTLFLPMAKGVPHQCMHTPTEKGRFCRSVIWGLDRWGSAVENGKSGHVNLPIPINNLPKLVELHIVRHGRPLSLYDISNLF